MTGTELMNGLSHISEHYIAEAEEARFRENIVSSWRTWLSAAACLCILIFGAVLFLNSGHNDSLTAENAQDRDMAMGEDGNAEAQVSGSTALSYEARLLRTGTLIDLSEFEKTTIISSTFDLEAFYSKYLEQVIPGGTGEFLTVEEYTEAYFDEHTLVVITLIDSGVNAQYSVTDVALSADGSLQIDMDKKLYTDPEAEGTGWCLLLSASTKIPFDAQDVNVRFTVEEG